MPRGKRTTIAPGIYQDKYGIAAVAKANGKREEERFPPDTPIADMQAWRTMMVRRLATEPPDTIEGTLADWIRQSLESVTSMPSYEARRADSEAWIPTLGQRDPRSILPREITTQLNLWAEQGYAASTLNHRRQAINACYAFMDPNGPNPVSGTQPRRPLPLEARALPWADVLELVAALPTTRAATLLRVMAHTGYPPARVTRLLPADLDAEASAVFLIGRRKGKGTKSERVRVSTDGLAALQEHFRHFPTGGGVTKTSWIVTFHQAVAAVNRQRAVTGREPLPEGLRPYDLRHSFGTKLYEETGDLFAVARTLGCSMETAERYTMGGIPAQIDKAITAINAANIRHAPRPREVALPASPGGTLPESSPADGADPVPGGTFECHPKPPGGTRTASHDTAKTGAISQTPDRVPPTPRGRLVPRKPNKNA